MILLRKIRGRNDVTCNSEKTSLCQSPSGQARTDQFCLGVPMTGVGYGILIMTLFFGIISLR